MKDKISSNQASSYMYFLIRPCFMGITINNLLLATKQDSIFAMILAIILGFIPLWILFKFYNYEPDLTGPEKINKFFGNFLGKLINIIIFGVLFTFIVTNYWNLVYFISTQYLHKTPTLVIGLLCAVAGLYLFTKPNRVINRTLFIFMVASLVLFIASFIGLVFQIDLGNLKPLFISSSNNFISSIKSFLSYNIIPLFLIFLIPKNKIVDNDLFKKKIVVMYLITSISLVFVMLYTTTIFSIELASVYQYPEFHVLKQASFLGFNARVESILALQWIIDLFMLILIGILYLKETVKAVINVDSKSVFFILIAIQLTIKEFAFNKTAKVYEFIYKILPNIILFSVIGLLLFTFIYKLRKKRAN